MGLKGSNLVAVATGTTALELKAEANESILVKAVRYYFTANGSENFSLTVDRRKVNEYVCPSGWFVGASDPSGANGSMVNHLMKRGLLRPIPVASGQTFNATAAGSGNAVEVVYDLYDNNDIKATDFNGSDSPDYQLFQVISNADAVTAAGDVELNQSDLDSQFPAFPGGKVVPANRRVEVFGLFGSPVTRGDGTNNEYYTTRLKIMRDREDILDQDLGGLLFESDSTHVSNAVSYTCNLSPLAITGNILGPSLYMFDTPLEFTAGTEVNVFATVAAGAGGVNVVAGDIKLGLLMNVYGI